MTVKPIGIFMAILYILFYGDIFDAEIQRDIITSTSWLRNRHSQIFTAIISMLSAVNAFLEVIEYQASFSKWHGGSGRSLKHC